MRIAVLADVHGNYHGLDAALHDVEAVGVDRIIVLGDLADRGPGPAACVERVREAADVCIKGNTDAYVIQMADGEAEPHVLTLQQYAPTRWAAAHLSAEHVAYLRDLPDQYVIEVPGLPAIRFVHGSPRSANEGITSRGEFGMTPDVAMALVAEPVLVFGHTHRSEDWQINGRWAINPGSVGQPFNDDAHAQYAILSGDAGGWTLERRLVDYDRAALLKAYHQSGYLAASDGFGRAAMLSALTGHNVLLAFILHVRQAANAAGVEFSYCPDDVYLQASDSFDWDAYEAGVV